MNNPKNVFYFVGILIITFLVGVSVGALGWKYFGTSKEEVKTPEIIAKDKTANWITYRNEEFGFELKYPEEIVTISYPYKCTGTNAKDDCLKGERIWFQFYRKSDISPQGDILGNSLFDGTLYSADFIPSGPTPYRQIIFTPSLELSSTFLVANAPTQWVGCSILQIAELPTKTYNEENRKFDIMFSLNGDFPLSEQNVANWKTECNKLFKENAHKFEPEIKKFDLVARSFKFLKN